VSSRDATLVEVRIKDAQGRLVPTANPEITFSISGPGRIIAVGNGDPASHEASRITETADNTGILDWKVCPLGSGDDPLAIAAEPDGPSWRSVFSGLDQKYPTQSAVYRGTLPISGNLSGSISLLLPPLGLSAEVLINGKKVAGPTDLGVSSQAIPLDNGALSAGNNTVVVITKPLPKPPRSFDYTSPGSILVVKPPTQWERKAFNGLAAVVVQAEGSPGTIILTASGPGLTEARQVLQAQ
jgi:beta-galactosidase